ncbi:MAG: hypothetical protein KME07_09670 [Pegethrix bostrychoides GSE-TBD4-15B]|jgi:hypothetical protein|uniref:4-fold beta flower domain-containing protein n=1 Tax=Pegethrix bostrychoides GSE-TBD4-15B TaxID=2839662 RepID=A0A951PAJ0_9CYAN|nr:hypothetical protein [Pegethrix bostrychoides GSE-TBD4-15B]
MSLDFYDQHGAPIAYSDDGEHIYTFGGRPVGYLSGGSIYGYSGKHLGQFENGLIRDKAGNVALFSQECSGGPIKPIKQIKPIKGIKQVRPIKGIKQIEPIKPISTLGWSVLSGEQFFG